MVAAGARSPSPFSHCTSSLNPRRLPFGVKQSCSFVRSPSPFPPPEGYCRHAQFDRARARGFGVQERNRFRVDVGPIGKDKWLFFQGALRTSERQNCDDGRRPGRLCGKTVTALAAVSASAMPCHAWENLQYQQRLASCESGPKREDASSCLIIGKWLLDWAFTFRCGTPRPRPCARAHSSFPNRGISGGLFTERSIRCRKYL